MEATRRVKTSDFDYDLPPDLIAQEPAARRDESRLLVLRRQPMNQSRQPSAVGRQAFPITHHASPITHHPLPITHHVFPDLVSLVAPNDVVVVNDSKVIPARLLARRAGGGAAEVLLVNRAPDGTWRALVRPERSREEGWDSTGTSPHS